METPQAISWRAPAPMVCQSGSLLQARLEVPNGRFHAAARHVVAANVFGAGVDFARVGELVFEDARRNVIDEQRPDGAGPFLVIERIFAGGDFAPAGNIAREGFD